MLPFAETALLPDGLLAWVIVGLLAGLFAGDAPRGRLTVVRDVAAGLAGAVPAGLLFDELVGSTAGFVGGVVAAFVGACALIAILRGLTIASPRA
jgi:uncharacterized membrane protein YeaQ/YmgE (transglycosylase-associated protein family)